MIHPNIIPLLTTDLKIIIVKIYLKKKVKNHDFFLPLIFLEVGSFFYDPHLFRFCDLYTSTKSPTRIFLFSEIKFDAFNIQWKIIIDTNINACEELKSKE